MAADPTTRSRWLRLIQHRRLDEADAHRALDAAAQQRLAARVAESEQGHTGEIRLCVEAGLPSSYIWRRANARARAIAMFSKLRVWDTEQNNGVLIYLLLAEHAIEIVADRGLARQVPAARWQAMVDGLAQSLGQQQFEAGLARAITEVGALLQAHFPRSAGEADVNELPDAPVMR